MPPPPFPMGEITLKSVSRGGVAAARAESVATHSRRCWKIRKRACKPGCDERTTTLEKAGL